MRALRCARQSSAMPAGGTGPLGTASCVGGVSCCVASAVSSTITDGCVGVVTFGLTTSAGRPGDGTGATTGAVGSAVATCVGSSDDGAAMTGAAGATILGAGAAAAGALAVVSPPEM